jgi:mRNA-degrading endonuclease RelE of RelBE toxin-antitoxin system
MNYEIASTDQFDREVKALSKKYRSFAEDLITLKKELLANPKLGDDLDNNTRKVRMVITSKNKGKRGGARVITYHLYIDEINSKIYLLTIYDKGERANISRKEILQLKQENNLL